MPSEDAPELQRRATDVRLHPLRDLLGEARFGEALVRAAASPSPAAWARFVEQLLLLIGAALVLSGLVYLVAFNWSELGRFGQFGLCAAWIVGGVGIAVAQGVRTPVGRVGLMAASVGVGAWLAVIGQTYQTGAHDWSLFAMWAGILLPWAGVARAPGLWMLVVVVANVAMARWVPLVEPWQSTAPLVWQAGFLGLLTAAWYAGCRVVPELRVRWAPRLLETATVGCLVGPAAAWVVGASEHALEGVAAAALMLLTGAAVAWTAWRGGSPFRATLTVVAALLVADVWLGEQIFRTWGIAADLGGFLLALVVLLQAGLFAAWATRWRTDPDEEVAA